MSRIVVVVVICLSCSSIRAAADAVDDEQSKYFQTLGHYIIEDRRITNELTETPTPLLDWGLIQPGFIAYVNKQTGQVLPLSGPHDLTDPAQVRAIPVAVPSGIRIRTQPASREGSFEDVLFKPAYPWEENCTVHTLVYDDADQRYKLWYETKDHFAYAESKDFKTWDRPLRNYKAYEQHAQTNLLGVIGLNDESALGDLRSADEARPGGNVFFVDPSAPPEQRYKSSFLAHVKPSNPDYARQTGRPLSAMTDPGSTVMFGTVSADGIGWRVLPKPIMLHDADTLTVTRYDVLLKRYVMYTRLYELGRRSVGYSETSDYTAWPLPTNVLSAGADDPPSVDFYASGFAYYPGRPDIRTMVCLVYDRAVDGATIRLASSRDGHAFKFVPGDPVIGGPGSPDAHGGFLSAEPSLVRTPDGRMIVFYNTYRVPHKFPRHRFYGKTQYAAVWPADRLAAVEATQRGEFTTAAMVLRGNRILLNMSSDRTGGIEVEMRDEQFRPVPGRSFAEADTIYGDHLGAAVTWKGESDVSQYTNQKIYLRLRLRAAKLFALAAGK